MPFCSFEAYLRKFTEKVTFYSKSDYLRLALKYSESLISLPYFKGENPKENLDLFKNFF